MRLQDLLADNAHFPMLDKIISIHRDGELYLPTGQHVDADPSAVCVTFDKLLRATPFVERVRDILARLEDVYGVPVDVEFAIDGEKLYILQCRTQPQAPQVGTVIIPDDIPEEDILFDARRYVRTGIVEQAEYIVYVDPAAYDAVPTRERRFELARVVGRVNRKLAPRSFILLGPGRWGSNDIRLGVPVRYADINHCALLIEVARQKDGFCPEVSFGTHFFQDLVEAGIHYLPLYPDDEGIHFNHAFLTQPHNALPHVLPDDAGFADDVRVIHVPAVTNGRKLTVVMDGETDRAIAYLK